MSFVHLHCHTHYSLLDGANRIPGLVKKAKEFGMPALAITDHGNLYGAIEFYSECTKAGIKPIIGMEAYVAPGDRRERDAKGISEAAYHLTLLAKNQAGFHNLIKLSSRAFLEGFYYRPRIDKEILTEHREGLIVLSGCLASEFSHLLEGIDCDFSEAKKLAEWYVQTFGRDFYIEIMNNGLVEQVEHAEKAVEVAMSVGVPLVATSDTHYLCQADSEAHDVLLCINTGARLHENDRFKFQGNQFHLRSPDEMAAEFEFNPEAIQETLNIAEKCNVEIDFKTRHFPPFIPPENKTHEQYLRELCECGITERYGLEISQHILDRFESEFSVICRLGFASYFLVVADFVRFAREQGIPVSARGSACGSLISYVLGISNVDPLEHGLLFERFLDPSRPEAPDIDIDFCQERREEVINYVRHKYGSDAVANIITFGRLGAKAAIRDVGRVMGVDLQSVNRIAKLIPDERDPLNPIKSISLADSISKTPELKSALDEGGEIGRMISLALKVEGTNRNAGVHAAGVVIADKPLVEYVPLAKNGDIVTTQWGMDDLAKVGLLKMDFLGLRNLTILGKLPHLLPKPLPLDDAKTFELIRSGNTGGIFQLDTDSARKIIAEMQPDKFEDITAIAALNRPATLDNGMCKQYIDVKNGKKPLEKYPHPSMGQYLDYTYGVMVYQEQVMQILHSVGGLPLSKSYTCIKSISKKKKEEIDKYQASFLEGAVRNGVPENVAREIFEKIKAFGGYGFNKSHSCAYAMIAYQTAYLKAHYPGEFMAALLSSEIDDTEKLVEHIADCRRIGLEVVPPNVNKSGSDFVYHDGKIYCSLAIVRNISVRAAKKIEEVRTLGAGSFEGLYEFCETIPCNVVNKAGIENLIKAGAFDDYGRPRSCLVDTIPRAVKAAVNKQKEKKATMFQKVMFDSVRMDYIDGAFSKVPAWSEAETAIHEKHVLGFYLTANPFRAFVEAFEQYGTHKISDLEELTSGTHVIVGGLISNVRYCTTKKPSRTGNYSMAAFDFSDLTGTVHCVIFPDDMVKQKELVLDDHMCFLMARTDKRYGQFGLQVQKIVPISKASEHFRRAVFMKVHRMSNSIEDVCRKSREMFPGLEVYLDIIGNDGTRAIIRSRG